MDSYKVVILSPNNTQGCRMLKRLFRKEFKIPEANRESLIFDYITFTVDILAVDWKIYLITDIQKFEEISSHCFSNVRAYMVVFDLATFEPAWERFIEAIKLHRTDSRIICLVYSRKDDNYPSMEKVVEKEMGQYFHFSEKRELEAIIEYLFQGRDGIRSPETTPA